jgi:hypothetical protein
MQFDPKSKKEPEINQLYPPPMTKNGSARHRSERPSAAILAGRRLPSSRLLSVAAINEGHSSSLDSMSQYQQRVRGVGS